MEILKPRIILKADDSGNNQAVYRGINQLVAEGCITDVAVMITFIGSRERDFLLAAIDQSPLRDKPGIGIPLHINFVAGKPLAGFENVPTLVDANGVFRRPKTLISDWVEYASTISPDDIRRELDAQVEAYQRLFGRYPHALDSHHMILAIPPVDEIAMGIALEMKVPITIPKIYADRLTKDPFSDVFKIDKKLLEKYHTRGIVTVDWEEVQYWNRFRRLETSVNRVADALVSVGPGITSFFFHPGHPDYLGCIDERFDKGRVRDFQILTHPKVREIIGTLALTSYKELFDKAQDRKSFTTH